jgi:hypothetical protein
MIQTTKSRRRSELPTEAIIIVFVETEAFRGVGAVGMSVGVRVGERVLGVGLKGGVGLVGRPEVGFFVGFEVGDGVGRTVVGTAVVGVCVGDA